MNEEKVENGTKAKFVGSVKLKTQSQIKMAQELTKGLQDYVSLAMCQNKLKLGENIEVVDKQITKLVEVIKKGVEEI